MKQFSKTETRGLVDYFDVSGETTKTQSSFQVKLDELAKRVDSQILKSLGVASRRRRLKRMDKIKRLL